MHPAKIKAALEIAGFSQAKLARSIVGRHGRAVSSAAVGHVIRGASRSQTIAMAISRATGLRLSELWPGSYAVLTEHEKPRSERRAKRDRRVQSGPAARLA